MATIDHECKYDADGGGCLICGQTVAEEMFQLQTAKWSQERKDRLKQQQELGSYCSHTRSYDEGYRDGYARCVLDAQVTYKARLEVCLLQVKQLTKLIEQLSNLS